MLCYYTYVFVSKWEIFIFDEGAAFQDSTKSITFITLAVTMWHWISLMDSSIHFYFSNYETYNFYGMYVHILELCSEILELLVLQFFIYLMFIVWNRYTHYPATAYFTSWVLRTYAKVSVFFTLVCYTYMPPFELKNQFNINHIGLKGWVIIR